ncbi:hypothetical protein [Xanthomonas campestris]|uniref:hypothetical protein n=1 Tax=Xanthomonas campestris TaxID=339 RepID=UPI001E3326B7|nr:hypothetical protein [Xanthomonas campestris]
MATQQGRYGIARAAVLVDEVGNGQQAWRGGHKWPLLQLLHAMGAHVSDAAFQDQKTVVVVRGLIVIGVRCDDHRLPMIDAPAASTDLDLQRAANRQHHLHMGVAVAIPVTPVPAQVQGAIGHCSRAAPLRTAARRSLTWPRCRAGSRCG